MIYIILRLGMQYIVFTHYQSQELGNTGGQLLSRGGEDVSKCRSTDVGGISFGV